MASKSFCKFAVNTIALFSICCGLAEGVAHAQSAQPKPASVQDAQTQSATDRAGEAADAIAKVRSGKFSNYDVAIIGEARAADAIPDLEKQFTLISDPLDKAKIAQVLLSLGDRKDVYWEYLQGLVKSVLESDVPDPTLYDAQGKQTQGLSKEFVKWAQAHGQAPNEAGEKAAYTWPGFVMLIGASGDSRALPLLRRAFSSPNYMIQIAAAKGLAEMQDVSSIPMLIARCKDAPPDVARLIAEKSLLYFDDAEAQKAVDTYVPKDVAKARRARKAAGKGALHGR